VTRLNVSHEISATSDLTYRNREEEHHRNTTCTILSLLTDHAEPVC